MSDDRGLTDHAKEHLFRYAKKKYKQVKQQYQAQPFPVDQVMQHVFQVNPHAAPQDQHQHQHQQSVYPQHPQPSYSPSGAPPPPPGAYLPAPSKPVQTLIPQETLQLIPQRPSSARVKFGQNAVLETRKGLSRVLNAQSQQDIHYFAQQLQNSDVAAVEPDWQTEDKVPIFAVSYVQKNPAQGRFKFDDDQWHCFTAVVQQLSTMGISQFRIWLDQCLWLRDASQGSWAHTGLLPYVLWPVMCLGKKQVQNDKSVASMKRMWPFLEEISGLWGMGVVYGREMRSTNEQSGWRTVISYQHRSRLEPEEGMTLLLHNIFHGAADHLHTGWQEDVKELKEMARANILMGGNELFVGSDWKHRIASPSRDRSQQMKSLTLPVKQRFGGDKNIYLENSRTVLSGGWHGTKEWLSGHDVGGSFQLPYSMQFSQKCWQVKTNLGEMELVMTSGFNSVLWLLVAMDGPTSNFKRGKVAWTKVMTGLGSCLLQENMENNNCMVVGQILGTELKQNVIVTSITSWGRVDLEWE